MSGLPAMPAQSTPAAAGPQVSRVSAFCATVQPLFCRARAVTHPGDNSPCFYAGNHFRSDHSGDEVHEVEP